PDSGWCAVVAKEHRNSSNDIAYALYAANGTGTPAAGHILVGTDRGAQGTSVLPLNTWSFLTATYNGSTLIVYVNGVQVGSRSVSGNIVSTTDPLRIGGDWSGEMFTGLIDNVRIYNRALSLTEIQTDMNAPIGGGAGGLELDVPPAPAKVARTEPLLSLDVLPPLRDEAIARWRAAGVSDEQLQTLDSWSFQVVDLPGSQLGFTSAGTIYLDRNAAGYGWFVDATPADDSEFPATPSSPAYGRVDLLTVIVHEIGHALGFEHEAGDGVMAESLPLGVRRMPTTSDVVIAGAGTPANDPTVVNSLLQDAHPAAVSGPSFTPVTVVAIASLASEPAAASDQEAGTQPLDPLGDMAGIPVAGAGAGDMAGIPVAVLDRVFADLNRLFPEGADVLLGRE